MRDDTLSNPFRNPEASQELITCYMKLHIRALFWKNVTYFLNKNLLSFLQKSHTHPLKNKINVLNIVIMSLILIKRTYWLMLPKFLRRNSVAMGTRGLVISCMPASRRYSIPCMAAILLGRLGLLSPVSSNFIIFSIPELSCRRVKS